MLYGLDCLIWTIGQIVEFGILLHLFERHVCDLPVRQNSESVIRLTDTSTSHKFGEYAIAALHSGELEQDNLVQLLCLLIEKLFIVIWELDLHALHILIRQHEDRGCLLHRANRETPLQLVVIPSSDSLLAQTHQRVVRIVA